MGERNPVKVTLNGGPYVDVTADIPMGQVSIGGGLEDDICVIGLDEAAIVVNTDEESGSPVLDINTSGFMLVELDGDASQVAQGESVALLQPRTLQSGSTVSLFFDPGLPAAVQRPAASISSAAVSAGVMAVIGGSVILAVIALLVLSFGRSANVETASLESEVRRTPFVSAIIPEANASKMPTEEILLAGVEPTEEVAPPIQRDPAEILAEARGALLDAIALNGLTGISVTSHDGALWAEGAHVIGSKRKWEDVQGRYEMEYSGSVPLVVRTVSIDPKPPFRVKTAWLGDAPQVQTTSNEIHSVGDIVAGGWRIAAIKSTFVELEYNGISMKIGY